MLKMAEYADANRLWREYVFATNADIKLNGQLRLAVPSMILDCQNDSRHHPMPQRLAVISSLTFRCDNIPRAGNAKLTSPPFRRTVKQ